MPLGCLRLLDVRAARRYLAPMLPAFLATFCFSISAICGSRAARRIGGLESNFWRLVVATLLLALWAHAVGGGLAGPDSAAALLCRETVAGRSKHTGRTQT